MQREGLGPATDLSPEDVFVTGYPKSGNTWFQILVAVILYGIDLREVPFSFVKDMAPDLSARRYFRRNSTPMYFKSHALPCPEYRRVVYLVRDGRDVMVSYKHYREVLDKRQYNFLDFVSADRPLWPCHWSEHVEAWEKNPYGANMIFIRYEDLLAKPMDELKRFCAFAGIERSEERLQMAIDTTVFKALQDKELKEGNLDPTYKSSKPFFRRGVIGSYADEMPPDVLARFLTHAAPTLKRFGYIVD